jgi:hypothetical protein
MSERQPEHPAVKIASVVGGIVFVTVMMMIVLAKEHLGVVGWIVVPLALMGVGLGWVASNKN